MPSSAHRYMPPGQAQQSIILAYPHKSGGAALHRVLPNLQGARHRHRCQEQSRHCFHTDGYCQAREYGHGYCRENAFGCDSKCGKKSVCFAQRDFGAQHARKGSKHYLDNKKLITLYSFFNPKRPNKLPRCSEKRRQSSGNHQYERRRAQSGRKNTEMNEPISFFLYIIIFLYT